jgi:hypothetical protein
MSGSGFRYEVVLKSNILEVVAVYADLDFLMADFGKIIESQPGRYAITDNKRDRVFTIEFARATKEAV